MKRMVIDHELTRFTHLRSALINAGKVMMHKNASGNVFVQIDGITKSWADKFRELKAQARQDALNRRDSLLSSIEALESEVRQIESELCYSAYVLSDDVVREIRPA